MTDIELKNKILEVIEEATKHGDTSVATAYGALHIALRSVEVLFDLNLLANASNKAREGEGESR